ncbi:PREDICTED: leucine-rich repeat and WD repeat-containing protein 1 [Nanorana parkeri]|uniref:leucine-rich repeat and WD repeat-containing protein 1 n=1 Tax=Nanorana parkeri TaxID=125878 RepID=UPI0008547CA2|nr:PREDICTED: leucine-rich repeat and WD repeat-containing protein 1 [Nanorana parkeri]
MTKLTTDILLKKGLPKSNHLKNLKTLGLSKMQLETKDLDPRLFSQMINLEELDISKNCLSEIPEKISLPKLKVLNFTDNQVEDVTTLHQFPNLEEVMYEENLYLTVSDNYKVCCLLPKLRRLNNKDITSLANHVRFVIHRELSSRVEIYWEKNYKDKLPDEPTPAMIKSVSKDFLKSVANRVMYGPNSLKDFTKWKVNIIAEEFISSLCNKKKDAEPQPEPVSANDDTEIPVTPSKKKRTCESDPEVRTPAKRLRTSAVITHALSPRRLSKVPESPQKSSPRRNKLNITLSPVRSKPITPVKENGKRGLPTPQKVSLRSTPSQKGFDEERSVNIERQKRELKKKGFDVEPLHFLQCHSKNNSSNDFRTQLWSCAFEPALDSLSSKVIATCGGESVCVIDCETGNVLKKYKVPGEEFFALAWTTLTMISNEGQKRNINVLAAGGKYGVVRLMHPKGNMCYGEIKAHKKAISIMCFSPAHDTFLFTGSYDKRIILWDIGVPDYEYNFRASQLLTLDTPSTPLRLCLVPSSLDQYLLGGCEDGCYVWDISLNKQQGRCSYHAEFSFPIYKKKSEDNDFHTIDGLAFLNDDLIASKSSMQGSIYIWSWKKSFLKSRSKSTKKMEAAVLAELKWSQTDIPYLSLTTSADGLYLFCGDEAGKVWIYDLESCRAELQKGVSCSGLKEPTKVIDWPAPISREEKMGETVINTVLVNPAKEYLVALTDKNIIAIWKIL